MKKTKLIALTMVVAIMMMGAGYALWSEQLFLDTTVRTGDFDMKITEISTRTGDNEIQNEIQSYNGNTSYHKFDWTHQGASPQIISNENSKIDGNSATVEFAELYPGGVVQVDMKMVNQGDIPARLKSVNVALVDGNQYLFNKLLAKSSWKADTGGNDTQNIYGHVNWDAAHNDGWYYGVQNALNALVTDLNDDNIIIEPNGWLKLGDGTEDGCIQFKLDPNVGNEYQDLSCKFKITFNWEQTDPISDAYSIDGLDGRDGDLPGIQHDFDAELEVEAQ